MNIKNFLKTRESIILFILSVLLGLTSLSFIAREVEELALFSTFDKARMFYLLYFIFTVLVLGTIAYFAKKFDPKDIIKKLLIVYLPVEIALLYGTEQSKHFHYLFNLATGLYIIAVGIYAIGQRKHILGNKVSGWIPFRNWLQKQGWVVFAVLAVVMLLNFSFGSYRLGKFAAVDEALWTFERIPRFWKNVGERDWNGTRISDKPGITVALTSGVGLLWENPKDYKKIYTDGPSAKPSKNIEDMNLALRFPLFLFTVLSLPFFYFFLERLLGKSAALYSVIFIGLSPLLLGMSRIINPDSLLWIFVPLSLLSFLVYLRRRNYSYLYAAGVLLGLALLTKYVANILFVIFPGLLFLEYIFSKKTYADLQPRQYLKELLLDYATLVFISLAIFFLLFPATWIKLERLLGATIDSEAFESTWPILATIIGALIADLLVLRGKVTDFLLSRLERYKQIISALFAGLFIIAAFLSIFNLFSGMQFSNFESILASPKSAFSVGGFGGTFFAGFYSLLFGIPVITSILFFIALLALLKQKPWISHHAKIVLYLAIIISLFYLGAAVTHVGPTVRYQIVIYPLALIVAGIGAKWIVAKVRKRMPKKYASIAFVSATLIVISSISLYLVKPFYFSYANSLLPKQYVLNPKDMGDGSYEAGEYLNSLPDASKLTVWTDKRGVCTVFIGKCYSSFNFAGMVKIKFDYYVVSRGRQARTTRTVEQKLPYKPSNLLRLDKLYVFDKPQWQLDIARRSSDFIKVISADEIDISYQPPL